MLEKVKSELMKYGYKVTSIVESNGIVSGTINESVNSFCSGTFRTQGENKIIIAMFDGNAITLTMK